MRVDPAGVDVPIIHGIADLDVGKEKSALQDGRAD